MAIFDTNPLKPFQNLLNLFFNNPGSLEPVYFENTCKPEIESATTEETNVERIEYFSRREEQF